MIDSVRLSADSFLDDKLFAWSVWQRHQMERGTQSYNQPNTFQREVHNLGNLHKTSRKEK